MTNPFDKDWGAAAPGKEITPQSYMKLPALPIATQAKYLYHREETSGDRKAVETMGFQTYEELIRYRIAVETNAEQAEALSRLLPAPQGGSADDEASKIQVEQQGDGRLYVKIPVAILSCMMEMGAVDGIQFLTGAVYQAVQIRPESLRLLTAQDTARSALIRVEQADADGVDWRNKYRMLGFVTTSPTVERSQDGVVPKQPNSIKFREMF